MMNNVPACIISIELSYRDEQPPESDKDMPPAVSPAHIINKIRRLNRIFFIAPPFFCIKTTPSGCQHTDEEKNSFSEHSDAVSAHVI